MARPPDPAQYLAQKLPEVTEIIRWEYRPGDRLIARVSTGKVSPEQAVEIADRIRASFQLPGSAPIVVAGEDWSFEVLSGLD
jgi:hypothetical protein